MSASLARATSGRAGAGAERLRVARICPVFEVPPSSCHGRGAAFDPLGGMQTDAGQLTHALDRLGVTQTVVTAYRPGAPRQELIGDATTVLRVGVGLRRLRQLYSVPAAWRLPQQARTADLVHAHLAEDLAVVPVALAAARLCRVPLVLTIHTSLTHTLSVTGPRSVILKTLGASLERLGVRQAAAVIVLTSRTGDLLTAGGVPRQRVHVIPPGVDPARFRRAPGDPPGDLPRPRIVFLGRLHAQKDVATLIRAAGLLPPRVHAVLAGDGPERSRLEALTDRLGLRGRVHFPGFVHPREVPRLLAGADVFVLPSRYEELGSVLLEAMCAGVPVVASRTGGIPALVRHGSSGLLVQPGDAAGFAAAVNAVLTDTALAGRLRAGGHAVARSQHCAALAEQVLDVYRQVTRCPPA